MRKGQVPNKEENLFLSYLNKFTLSAAEARKTPEEEIINEIVEKVLWQTGGEYEGSVSKCPSFAAEIAAKPKEILETDRRLLNWENNLKRKTKIEKKLMGKTGKTECELLLNSNLNHRRIQLTKRLLDRIEPILYPRANTYDIPRERQHSCTKITYEDFLKIDRPLKPLEVIDLPNVSLKEQGLLKCIPGKWSWLASKYLRKKLHDTCFEQSRVVRHAPGTPLLQVLPVQPPDKTGKSFLARDSSMDLSVNITTASLDVRETSYEYVLYINNVKLELAKRKYNKNFVFNSTITSETYDKVKTVMVTLRNDGCKSVNFSWKKPPQRCTNQLARQLDKTRVPAFYFNKNEFMLIPGQTHEIMLIFCSKNKGLYDERWNLIPDPNFFQSGFGIGVNLFGYCSAQKEEMSIYRLIKDDLAMRAKLNMSKDLLVRVAGHTIHEPVPIEPYNLPLTDEQIFMNANHGLVFDQSAFDQLKDLYKECIALEDYIPGRQWTFEIETFKKLIMNVVDTDKRRYFHMKLVDILDGMKGIPKPTISCYEQQKFVLVKSIFIITFDKIEEIATDLKDSIYKTELHLEMDEVLVLKECKKHTEMTLGGCCNNQQEMGERTVSSTDTLRFARGDYDGVCTDAACIIKSETVRKKQTQIFKESLHYQISYQLGQAADEIEGIIQSFKIFD